MQLVLQFLILMMCLLGQSCQQINTNDDIALHKKPDLSKAASFNVQLGLGYLKQGDRPRAKKKLLTALEQEPTSADVNAGMAYYLEQTGELQQAKNYYAKALFLSANSGAQLNNYGTFLCRQGEYKNAEPYFLKAVADPHYLNTAGAYENAALCALAAEDTNKANEYFVKALNQDPSKKESLYELVKLKDKQGYHVEAFMLLQKYPDLVLNDRMFLSFAKNIARKAGQLEKAAEYENRFKQMNPNIDTSGVNNEYNDLKG